MKPAHAHERENLRRIIDAHERELDHRADVIATLADSLADAAADLTTARAELDEAVDRGTQFATALRYAMPNSPALLVEGLPACP